MNREQFEKKLEDILSKLNQSAEKIVETQGYNRDAQQVKILESLIKEQIRGENSRNTTR